MSPVKTSKSKSVIFQFRQRFSDLPSAEHSSGPCSAPFRLLEPSRGRILEKCPPESLPNQNRLSVKFDNISDRKSAVKGKAVIVLRPFDSSNHRSSEFWKYVPRKDFKIKICYLSISTTFL